MTIKSAFLWTSIHTVTKVLLGILMNKIIAIYLGPSGLALIGQFQNFIGIVASLANGSIQTGLTKYVAEYQHDKKNLYLLLKNSLLITFILSLISIIFLIAFADTIAKKVFFDQKYTYVIYFFSFSVICYSFNSYILAILNGFGKIKSFTLLNIFSTVTTFFLASFTTILYGIEGVYVSLIVSQIVILLSSLYFIRVKELYLSSNLIKHMHYFDKQVIKKLLHFSSVTFLSSIIVNFSMIILRYLIGDSFSLVHAGAFEAVMKITAYFNMLFILPFSIYYLPKFSAEKHFSKIHQLLIEGLSFITPAAIFLFLLISFNKDLIILSFFTKDFMLMQNLIDYFIIGEIIRFIGLSIAHIFMSKTILVKQIINELLFYILLISGIFFVMEDFDFKYVGYSYIIASCLFSLLYLIQYKTFKRGISG